MQEDKTTKMIQKNEIIIIMQLGGTTTIMLGDGIITNEEIMKK